MSAPDINYFTVLPTDNHFERLCFLKGWRRKHTHLAQSSSQIELTLMFDDPAVCKEFDIDPVHIALSSSVDMIASPWAIDRALCIRMLMQNGA